MSGALRNAVSRGLAQTRIRLPASGSCRGFAERPAEAANPAGTAQAHGEGTSYGQFGVLVPVLVGGAGAWYIFGRTQHSTTARTPDAGSGQAAQQEKRPPSAGMTGQQAQRTFDSNRAAGAHPEANVQNKMAAAGGASDETGGNKDTQPEYGTGKNQFASTNDTKGPNYESKK